MKIDKDAFGQFFDGTPGKSWDDYASRLKNAAAGEVDERGYSLADEFEGVAEGQPAAGRAPNARCGCATAQSSGSSKATTERGLQHAHNDDAGQRADRLSQTKSLPKRTRGVPAFQYMQNAMAGGVV